MPLNAASTHQAAPPPAARSQTPHLARLRVLAGVHRGAAVLLREGACQVGSSIGDDVVLRDTAVLESHLLVDAGPRRLSFVAMAPGWALGGVALDPGVQRVLHRSHRKAVPKLTVGSTVIGIEWPDADASTPTRVLAWLRRWWQHTAVGAAAALAAVAGFALWTAEPALAPRTLQSAALNPIRALEWRIQQAPPWRGIALSQGQDQRAELVGAVERREDLDVLLRTPEAAALSPTVRVVVEQELRRQIQELVGDTEVAVSFDKSASAASNVQHVVVAGSTPRPGVAAALKLLGEELKGRIEIEDRTLYAPNEADRKKVRVELPIRIASVNVSDGYVESSDGARYFEGSVVSGYRIETIEREKVVFSVGGKRVEFPVP